MKVSHAILTSTCPNLRNFKNDREIKLPIEELPQAWLFFILFKYFITVSMVCSKWQTLTLLSKSIISMVTTDTSVTAMATQRFTRTVVLGERMFFQKQTIINNVIRIPARDSRQPTMDIHERAARCLISSFCNEDNLCALLHKRGV